MTTLIAVLDRHPRLTKAVVLAGSADDIHRLGSENTPVYRQHDRALRALAHAYRYAVWRGQPPGQDAELGGIQPDRAAVLIKDALGDTDRWVPRRTAVDILAAYGIAVLPASCESSGVGAVAAAERLGFPVVLTMADAAAARRVSARHGLTSAVAVRETFDTMTRRSDPSPGVLVQHQLTAPLRLVAGITQTPDLGPVVRLAVSGRPHDDVRSLVPLTDLDAARAWCRLLVAPSPAAPVSSAGIEDLLLRLSALAGGHPEMMEVELDPVLAGPNGVVAANARMRLAAAGPDSERPAQVQAGRPRGITSSRRRSAVLPAPAP